MLKRTLFPLLAGLFVGAIIVATPSVEAACQGYCADHTIRAGCTSDFAGCSMHYDAQGQLEDVDCFYVNACPLND